MNDNWWIEVNVTDRNMAYVIGPLTFDEKQEFEIEITDGAKSGKYSTLTSWKYLRPITVGEFRRQHAGV